MDISRDCADYHQTQFKGSGGVSKSANAAECPSILVSVLFRGGRQEKVLQFGLHGDRD
jgi:hypothetical protein